MTEAAERITSSIKAEQDAAAAAEAARLEAFQPPAGAPVRRSSRTAAHVAVQKLKVTVKGTLALQGALPSGHQAVLDFAFATLGMVHGLMCLAPWFVESQKCSSFWVARVANEFQHVLLDVQATLTTAAAMTPQMRMTPAAAAVTATLTATVTSPLPAASAQQQAQRCGCWMNASIS